jgi:hypothetical protein
MEPEENATGHSARLDPVHILTSNLLKTHFNIVTCPGFCDKELTGSGLDEAVYWITRLQLKLQSLRNNVFQTMWPNKPVVSHLAFDLIFSESESYITTDGHSPSLSWNKAPIWGLRQDLYYCQTVAGLLIWSALFDERTGLSFTVATGPRQCIHSWVRVPWDSRPYFIVSYLRFPFSLPPTIAGLRWGYSTPPSTRDCSLAFSDLKYLLQSEELEDTFLKVIRCSGTCSSSGFHSHGNVWKCTRCRIYVFAIVA